MAVLRLLIHKTAHTPQRIDEKTLKKITSSLSSFYTSSLLLRAKYKKAFSFPLLNSIQSERKESEMSCLFFNVATKTEEYYNVYPLISL